MKKGFTLIELLIVIGILTILASTIIPVYGNFQVSSQMNEASTQIIQSLRKAREYSVARYNNSSFGVYFEENLGDNDRFIFYQGNSYITRDSDYDKTNVLYNSLNLTTSFAGNDINFSKSLGLPNNIGTIILATDKLDFRTIEINDIGMVDEN